MTPRLTVGRTVNPVRMRLLRVVVRRVWIRARDDDHAEFTASSHEVAKRVTWPKPRAAVVERNGVG